MEHIPGITELFNSSVSIDKHYVNESELLDRVKNRDPAFLRGSEFFYNGGDLLDLDSHIRLTGPCCAYVYTYFKLDAAEKLWLVVGNNAPFAAWLDGEKIMHDASCRFWMPYNNEKLVELDAGMHSLLFKVLRVDTQIAFSLAIKEFAEVHHHRSHFKIGLTWVY